MKIGIVFGCFIPLHKGHLKLLSQSFIDNDLTIIAVCGKDDDRGKDFIPFQHRIKLMGVSYYSHNIRIVALDDEKLGMDGSFSRDNWVKWSNELFRQAELNPDNPDNTYTWYTGESSYEEKLSSIYPDHTFVIVDRSEDTISGTQIRKDPKKYWDKIDTYFREYLLRKGY